MRSFLNGLLVGLGISFLLAPKPGRESRRFLKERFYSLRNMPQENEMLRQEVQQMSERAQNLQRVSEDVHDLQEKVNQAAQMESAAHNYVQETARSANSVQNNLRDVTPQTEANATTSRPQDQTRRERR